MDDAAVGAAGQRRLRARRGGGARGARPARSRRARYAGRANAAARHPGGGDRPAAAASTRSVPAALLGGSERCRNGARHGLLGRKREDALLARRARARRSPRSARNPTMTERELARIVRAALDESAGRLPAPIAHRLAAARAAALARAERGDRRRTHEAPRARALPRTERPRPQAPRLAWRIAAIVVPISLVAGGLFGISVWESQQR